VNKENGVELKDNLLIMLENGVIKKKCRVPLNLGDCAR